MIAANEIYTSAITDELKGDLIKGGGEVQKFVNLFLNRNEKKGKKMLAEIIESTEFDESFKTAALACSPTKKQSSGFFKRLFK